MRKYPAGTVIVDKSVALETLEQTVKRIYNTDIDGFWNDFEVWEEKHMDVRQCAS